MTEADWLAADIDARHQALDVGRSFIVQAPAGSGKTELLIQRYLRLLAVVDEPEEVVAITFTRKAAAEMRERVVAALERAASADNPATAHERVTYEAALAALTRDSDRDWNIRHARNRLRIQTLDALCASIQRMLPVTAGPANRRMIEGVRAAATYRAAALATLDWLDGGGKAAAATERVLTHLDGDVAIYVDQLSAMLELRDQWLGITGTGRLDQPAAVREKLEAALARAVSRHLRAVSTCFSRVSADWLSLAQYAGAKLLESGRSENWVSALANLDRLPAANPDGLTAWRGIAELSLTVDGNWRKPKGINKTHGFPPDDDGEKAAWIEILKLLNGDDELRRLLADVRNLPTARYTDSQWQVLQALILVLPLAVSELQRLFARQGVTDFLEVMLAARAALGQADTPGDVALMLDYRIRHLLVDEMQDTSIAQYDLIETLTAGWSPGDGHSIFCVGDPMQSIYRFRHAEVGRFVQAMESGLESLPLEALVLRRNFRSSAQLVDWYNAVFARVLPGDNDAAAGAVAYSSSVAADDRRLDGAVRLHALRDASAAREAATAAEAVRDCLATDPEGSVAILVRSRAQVADLLGQLQERHIDCAAIDIDRLTDRPELIELIALARALAHPADRAAWLALLRSPLVGLDWQDLHSLVLAAPDRPVIDLLAEPARLDTLSSEARERLPPVIGVLDAALSAARLTSFRNRVERTWHRLGGPCLLPDPGAAETVERFLDLLEREEDAGTLADPATLREWLDGERVSVAATELSRVQIMTMHKAKGLEFDHVVLPALGRVPRSNRRKILGWLAVPGEHGATDLLLAPIGARYDSEADAIHSWIDRASQARDDLETDRLLYVACTRARRSLHLVGTLSSNPDGEGFSTPRRRSLLSRLWPVLEKNLCESAAADLSHSAAAESTALQRLPRRRLANGWTSSSAATLPDPIRGTVLPASAADREVHFEWVGSVARHAGTIVHRWLQLWVAKSEVPSTAAAESLGPVTRRWARELGVSDDDLPEVQERVTGALQGLLADARGRWILEGKGHAEIALTGVVDSRLDSVIIDRVRIDGPTHWIIDYKTGTHEGGDIDGFILQEQNRYRPQLQRYADIYSAYQPDADVRIALYFPLLQRFVELESNSLTDAD